MRDGNSVWLSAGESATLLGVSKRTVERSCTQGKFKIRFVSVRGGKQYQILLSSLPEATQVRYWSQQISTKNPADTLAEQSLADTADDISLDANAYRDEPTYNRKVADKYINLFQATDKLKGAKLEQAIAHWNAQNPDMATSYRSLVRARKIYAEQGLDGLIGKYGKTKNRLFSIEELGEIGHECFELFRALFMREGAPTLASCYRVVRGRGIELWSAVYGGDVTEFEERFPCAETFHRALEKQVGVEIIYRARYGEAAWNRKYANYVNRDYSAVRAGEIWVSDHRQLDQIWIGADGVGRRPWITAWCCFKTQKYLAWSLHFEAPNADHVIDTFASAVEKYGVPRDIYVDNGKDYRSKDFAGGRRTLKVNIDTRRARSVVGVLRTNVHFAAPYNGQTKIIERTFLKFAQWLDAQMPGYVATSYATRPDDQLAKQNSRGQIIRFDAGVELLSFFITEIMNRTPSSGKTLKGRTPDEAFAAEFKGLPRVSPDTLALLRARNSEVRSIGRNGVRENQLDDYYYADWMEQYKGKKVYLRRTLSAMQTAWIFDADTEEFLGKATLGAWSAPALARTDLEREQVQQVLAQKKRTRKAAKIAAEAADVPAPMELLRLAALGGSRQAEEPCNEVISVAQMTRYDEATTAHEEMQRSTGTDGIISALATTYQPTQKPKKQHIKMFNAE